MRLYLIIVLVHKLNFMECFQDQRNNSLDRVLSECFPDTDSLSSQEWNIAHGVMLATSLEPLGLELVVVASPLIF